VKSIRIALDVADPLLADRLASLLGGTEGIELVSDGTYADVVLAQPRDMVAQEEASADIDLTPREREVLALLAEGASNKAIARRLGISSHTAKFHVGSLIAKLDAIGRTDVVAHAARLGVIRL
jgi:DNA-binding CsgD family transcriptional regulator